VSLNDSTEYDASFLNTYFYLEVGDNSFLTLDICPEVTGGSTFPLENFPEDGASRLPQNNFIMSYPTCVTLRKITAYLHEDFISTDIIGFRTCSDH
jgi:hypothetical protein